MNQNGPERPELVLAVAQSIAVPGDVEQNVQRHLHLVSMAAQKRAQVLFFPELSLTGYSLSLTSADALTADDSRLQPLCSAAGEHGIVIVAGGPVVFSNDLCIGAIIFSPDGSVGFYYKEYLHEGEEIAFTPGPGGSPFAVGREIVGLAICADVVHPEHAHAAAVRGATVYAAGCFITEAGYAADTALLCEHAIDHRMLVMMANYGGPTVEFSSAGKSAIWSEDGTLIACAPAQGEALCLAERFADGWKGRMLQV